MSNTKNVRRVSRVRGVEQAGALTATAAAAMLLLGGAAQAQQADGQTVTVTGIRAAIESAISVKKNADGVVEAISAEDIGKLPDTTIAESLARLPGVTAQRDRNGQATNVNIRGLGADFNGYLLNGREQTSTGDSRAVDLSVYPAELIGSATVYKSSDAALPAAGLAGTIDNKLIDPLAFRGRVISGKVEKTRTGVGLPDTSTGKRYSLAYIDQFADRTVGLAVGFVHSDDTISTLVNGSWGSSNIDATLAADGSVVKASVPFGGGLSFETDRKKDKRDGLAAILEYKPFKEFTSQVDLYWAKINTQTKKMAAKGGTFGGNITDAVVDANGVAVKGTYQIAADGLIVYNENVIDDDKINSLGWRNTWKFADSWTGSLDISHNKAKRVEKDIEAYGGVTSTNTLTFDSTQGSIPQFTLGSPSAYTDPAQVQIRDQTGWSGVTYRPGTIVHGVDVSGQTAPQAGYYKGPTVTDKADAVRLDLSHDLGEGLFPTLQFGLNYAKRSKDRFSDEGLIVSSSGTGYDRIPYPAGSYVQNNVGGTGLSLITFDPQVGLWPGAELQRKYNDDILSKSWTVDEKVTTAYAKLDIDTKMGAVPLNGNVGVQIVATDQSSAGYRAGASSTPDVVNPANGLSEDGYKYTDFLPSLNLKGDLGGGNILRFGLAKQIARPTLTDMRNSFALAVDTDASHATFGELVGSSGNPRLKPFRATALDLAYEKYFGTKAYLGAAAFYKKLDTYIVPTTGRVDFTELAAQVGVPIPAAGPVGTYTTTVNGKGGNLRGIELSASLPFDLLAEPLRGFGLSASYSRAESSVKLPNLVGLNPSQQVPDDGITITLPGLSKTNAKLIFYYEAYGFSAFIAENRRSKYIGPVAGSAVGGYPALAYIDDQRWVSAQVGYEFDSGPLKGLGIRFEGNNLNKPTYRELRGDGVTPNFEQKTGAIYAFKLSYKYD